MAIEALARLGRNLLYGFRRELRPCEAEIFQQVVDASSPSDRLALLAQLKARERVQRWSRRVLHFGLPPGGDLMTHRGLVSTMEFSKDIGRRGVEDFKVERVKLHPGGSGYVKEIDASEHEHGASA